ncbi:MAG: TetR/AcrR family transcriptional regulator [Alloprevotella sp.]|nr:TetR/AcrR family transcriptional regulator [Alloprevotella sp.]
METRDKIIATAQRLFFRHGIKAVRMDDIAQSIHISKRTLYQLFPDKKTLLLTCIATADEEHRKAAQAILSSTDNILEIALRIFRIQAEEMKAASHIFILEASQNPDVINFIESLHRHNSDEMRHFIQRGVEQGYFRSDVNYEIIQRMFYAGLNTTKATELLSLYKPIEIFQSTHLVMLRGCLTEKGMKLLQQFESQA